MRASQLVRAETHTFELNSLHRRPGVAKSRVVKIDEAARTHAMLELVSPTNGPSPRASREKISVLSERGFSGRALVRRA